MSNPSIGALVPDKGVFGEEYQIDIYGSDFQEGATVAFETGITVSKVSFQHAGHLIARIDIATGAAKKKYAVTVTNPGSETATKPDAFEVKSAPVITYA